MFRHVPMWLVLLIAFVGALTAWAFAALALSGEQGGRAPLNGLARDVAGLPAATVARLTGSSFNPFVSPEGAEDLPGGFWRDPSPEATDDGHLLLALYDPGAGEARFRLIRLSDGAVVRDYRLPLKALDAESRAHETPATAAPGTLYRPNHAELMPDGGLVFVGGHLLTRIDACGKVMWSRPGHHHSVERDDEGNIWTPAVLDEPGRPDVGPTYRNDGLTLTSPNGRRLYARGLTEIFLANGLGPWLRGAPRGTDPFHLNDIEPVTSDGPHWRRGDLFLSLRHYSMVALYRPSTDRIVWSKVGPWLGQHDVVVLDDHRIAVFDNGASFDESGQARPGETRELVYDFFDGSVTSPWEAGFRRNGLSVPSNGRGLPLPGGDLFVEDSVHGQALRMSAEGDVKWRWVNADDRGRRHWMFWSRPLGSERYAAGLAAAAGAKCG